MIGRSKEHDACLLSLNLGIVGGVCRVLWPRLHM